MGETAWRSRIIGHGEEPPDQLLANPRNWRIHPKAQQDALAGVLSEVGWVQDVIVNQRTGHVIDGHARIEIAISRNEPSVPVVYVDLDENEEGIVLAALDPLAAMAVQDPEKWRALLSEISVTDEALRAMLMADEPKAGLTDPDDVPVVETPITQPGDLWLLGEHRLLCGDSTKVEDVALLLGDALPVLTVTDPPYGVEYDPHWRDDIVGEFGQRDARGDGATNDDIADWSEAWRLSPSAVMYCWHAGRFASTVQQGLESAGFEVRSQIVWAKQHFAISRGHYHWMHEPCWYAVRGGATASWIGDRKQTTMWEISSLNPAGRQEERMAHGTQKPIECMERPIRNHSGDVYDPFLGSGTTLIACERLGRRCYAMEIEPKYVDVAVKRWEQFTGRSAVLESAASTNGTTRGRSTSSRPTRGSTGKTKASAK